MTAPVRDTVGAQLEALGCPVNPGRALVRAGLKRRQADRLLATPLGDRADQVQDLNDLLATQASGGLADSAEATRALALDLLAEPALVAVRLVGPAWLDPASWLPPDGRVPPAQARRLHQALSGRHVDGQRLEVLCDPPLRIGQRRPPREAQAIRRRRLFSRWDQGVRWDDTGLFSATPEALADGMVVGAQGVAFDAGCGLGSLALALARQPGVSRVIAVDTSEIRVAHARHNAHVYGVADRVEVRLGDAVTELARTPCDVLVCDPPWGGRDYDRTGIGLADLGLPLAALLDHAPGDTRLKLPPSFLTPTLPGDWRWRPAVDPRGALKFVVATRA